MLASIAFLSVTRINVTISKVKRGAVLSCQWAFNVFDFSIRAEIWREKTHFWRGLKRANGRDRENGRGIDFGLWMFIIWKGVCCCLQTFSDYLGWERGKMGHHILISHGETNNGVDKKPEKENFPTRFLSWQENNGRLSAEREKWGTINPGEWTCTFFGS